MIAETWVLILFFAAAPQDAAMFPNNEQPWKYESRAECTVKLEQDLATLNKQPQIGFIGCVPFKKWHDAHLRHHEETEV